MQKWEDEITIIKCLKYKIKCPSNIPIMEFKVNTHKMEKF